MKYRSLPGRVVVAGLILSAFATRAADAQSSPRFGFGPTVFVSPQDELVSEQDVALGGLFRVSQPLNQDLSLAAGAGFAAFVLDGSKAADYAFNPQLSLIVTLPGTTRFPYILMGFGGYVPFGSENDRSGFITVHAGVGWAWPLKSVSIFLEADPALAIREESTSVVVPIRAGVIF